MNILSRYRAVFRIHEIDNDTTLQWLSGALLLGFHFTFSSWTYSEQTTVKAVKDGTYACWPFLHECKSLIFLSTLPEGYSQPTLYMGLFGLMLGAVYAMYLKRWDFVHLSIFVLLLFKIYFMAINYQLKPNYHYLHSALCVVYVLGTCKRLFLQLTLVSFYSIYLISWAAPKTYPSWSLSTGANSSLTIVIVLMAILVPWLLFSPNRIVQRLVLLAFALLHFYAGILGGYGLPVIAFPALLILFGPWYKGLLQLPFTGRVFSGWAS
ncbi:MULTISPECIES: hypothetical protein [unclassified Bradyrhizobium]|uniref:hypothetical protein n=1 Tax=unclassified Bradyrhizobium TaxID=2631580 RepID=UPI002915D78E|nr:MULTISPECIES: hypothetical protein [unclassified Bradyrhizobium]